MYAGMKIRNIRLKYLLISKILAKYLHFFCPQLQNNEEAGHQLTI